MKIYGPIILMALTFARLAANAQAGGCGDPRAQVCNPGQYVNYTNANETACLPCGGNTVANGCTRSCSPCSQGTVPDSQHSSCVAAPGQGGTPVVWSPHSKPFDLIWDVNNVDYNSLPLNPQWAYQLSPGGLPNFNSICGSAFSGLGNIVNPGTLAKVCTSQQTTFDIANIFVDSVEEVVGNYCQGLLNGHLTWMNATYVGWVRWDSWSEDPDPSNFNLRDGDYNLLLQTFPNQFGFTNLNWSPGPKWRMGHRPRVQRYRNR